MRKEQSSGQGQKICSFMDNKAAFYYSEAEIEERTRLGPDEPTHMGGEVHME